jgi:hypothetical protein
MTCYYSMRVVYLSVESRGQVLGNLEALVFIWHLPEATFFLEKFKTSSAISGPLQLIFGQIYCSNSCLSEILREQS